jgi:hypothetical protein
MAVTINASTTSGFILNSDTSGELQLQTNGTPRLTVGAGGTTTVANLSATAYTPTTSLITSGTAVNSTSGTSIDFTGIPSWVKRVTVVVNGLSYAAAGQGVIRIGSGSLTTSGYTAIVTTFTATPSTTLTTITNGLASINTASGSGTIIGQYVLTNITGNTWILSGTASRTSDAVIVNINGSIALGGTLDRLSLVATTSTFDGGTINILYE